MSSNWLLWDHIANEPFVGIYFQSEASALKHRKLVVEDLKRKLEQMTGVGTKEVPSPLAQFVRESKKEGGKA